MKTDTLIVGGNDISADYVEYDIVGWGRERTHRLVRSHRTVAGPPPAPGAVYGQLRHVVPLAVGAKPG